MAIISRLLCSAFVAILEWWTDKFNPSFKARVIQHYELHLMHARLRMDLSTAADPDSQARVSTAHDAWTAFESIISFNGQILTSASQLALIIHASRSTGGPIFALLCMAKPFMRAYFSESIWSRMFVVNKNNTDYQRMDSLVALTGDQYRQDFITGNLGGYIIEEYKKARDRLGDTCTDEFYEQWERKASPIFDVMGSMAGDFPMIYCAINSIINPTKFSIASIAVLQQSSTTLRYSLHMILFNANAFQKHVTKLKKLYTVSQKKSQLQDGDLPYPGDNIQNKDGMGFELRDITFAYPGSQNKTTALTNISLTIKPGQLVVIVGANGSGKSTLIKLLTRLYDPISGTVLIDDLPVRQYRSSDLRQTMATFTQDHQIYPLSLYENIALGNPALVSDTTRVAKAAEQGGASEFIAKLVDGMDTILDPGNSAFSYNVPDDPEHALKKQLEKLSKKVDISGGEKQRLVASRTFMHLNSGKVNFVAVDEPSSALDAEGEAQLFDRLIAARAGKTMVFVTHRFGHLTKHADVIICMKEGLIAESGSHEDLLKLDGEYAKLYKIQADAFASGKE
ncbi:P-loop containing nucleoside triphosphate hydrolase protein [Lyophyllum atratum]|nr:P-loop containing nucleoside triphosphate hydrolase protein [Lyophyllum atratum]